jgi:hypothetical protein
MTKEIITPEIAASMTNEALLPPTEAEETLEISQEPMTALARLKDGLKDKRNLDTGFETTDFDISNAITMVMELDKFTKVSVFNSWKFFLNMQCIRQAMRLMPDTIEKTSDGRDLYDQAIIKAMEDFEGEGDFVPTLPAFIALNEHLRVTMYDDLLEPSTMEDTLEFMIKSPPVLGQFEKDYEARLLQGQRPGISKRDFCELQLEDAMKQYHDLAERGQAAIEFCNDLKINEDRGWGDLPDWAVDTLYNKLSDKLTIRWSKLDIRRTGLRIRPTDRLEAEADQELIEFVYKALTGNEFATEY